MSIHPIRNESDYEAALDTIEHLMDLNPAPNTTKADELEVLTMLVKVWEDEHHPIPTPASDALLRFVLEQGVTPIESKDEP